MPKSKVTLTLDMSDMDNTLLLLTFHELLENDQEVKMGMSNLATPENFDFLKDMVDNYIPYMNEIRQDEFQHGD